MARLSGDEGDRNLQRSLKAFQDNVRRAGPAAVAGYSLIGAIILLGGIGYAIDVWRGTSHWFLLSGLLLGLIVGFYELAKTVWRPLNVLDAMTPVWWMAGTSFGSWLLFALSLERASRRGDVVRDARTAGDGGRYRGC